MERRISPVMRLALKVLEDGAIKKIAQSHWEGGGQSFSDTTIRALVRHSLARQASPEEITKWQ